MRRVVLDSNVWISGIIIPGSISSNLTTALIQGREQGITSHYILKEIERALFSGRIRFKYQVRREEIVTLLWTLQNRLEVVEPVEFAFSMRDPTDLPILGTALAGQATHLVTGDRDFLQDQNLLSWMRERGVLIVSPRELKLD
jgi:putative PIN family toxin of toxin-antitoxin system